jgi:hypothetical protein
LGRKSTRAEVRHRYDIPVFETAVRKELFRCKTCAKNNPKPINVPLAPLHRNRLVFHKPPFTSTGMDYFGPFVIASGCKVYGLLFTCLTMRAVHLEICKGIDNSSCMQAIDRFINRRGKPEHIQCDLGSSFVGVNNDMKRAIEKLSESLPAEAVIKYRIDIDFNAAGSPNQGGAWERLIKDVKRCIYASVENMKKLSYEAFQTLLIRIEAIMNNRPLAFDDAGIALTPNLFLNPTQIVIGTLPFETSSLKVLQQIQLAESKFWKDWRNLYLFSLSVDRLQRRGKFIQLKPGDQVLIDDSNDSKISKSWTSGKIVEVFTSPDGVVRSAKVETPKGIEIRGMSRIFVNEAVAYDHPFWNLP